MLEMPESFPDWDEAEVKKKKKKPHPLKGGQNKLRRQTETQEGEHELGKRSPEFTGKMGPFFPPQQPHFLKQLFTFKL